MFWLGYFAFNVLRWGNYFDDYEYSFKSNVVEFAIHIVIVYSNIFYLIPKFILRKKYKTYLAIVVFILFMVYVIRTGLNYVLVTKEAYPESVVPSSFFDINYIIEVILGELYVISFVTSIKFIVEWFLEKKKNEDLAKLQLSTELKYLRTQIQPHFFFNTLNNLYALALQKSDNAPKLVIKLSEMMQYVLYEIDGPKTDLLNEIKHINNYMDIERLRFDNRVEVDLDITGDIEDVKVPPLLLLSFVENCFKHGMKGNDFLKIKMSFKLLNNGYLEFSLINNFNPEISREPLSGIGNENAKRRLNLLFSSNYVLESKEEGDIYNLFLKIPVQS
ncbi:histidine kinase [Seonamhaeicola maritimus]|uniref:Histidine kinase n=1 Tax=Seonamhaeicola maritimus TaxID=2591822 RepID=A0A5C7GI81_9FLAO|nr:histidine kinase [Seonamhaeicola maritimus]